MPAALWSRMMKRLFLVGSPRSGTTLLQSLLAAHPAIISVPESRFFQYLLDEQFQPAFFERLTQFFENEIHRPEFLSYFNPEQSETEKARCFLQILDQLAHEQYQSIWLEKTPEHLAYIDYLEGLLPDALFIHILRNPLDVIASLYEASRKAPEIWGGNWSLEWCIERWKDSVLISHRQVMKPHHFWVWYEELVEHPQIILEKLCEFIGIKFTDLMLVNYQQKAKDLSLQAVWHQGIDREIKPRKTHKYHQLFKREEIEYILKTIKPVKSGIMYLERVEITRPLVGICPPAPAQRLYCTVEFNGEQLGNVELPVIDGRVDRWVLADAIATQFAWEILGAFFQQTLWQGEEKAIAQALYNEQGWTLFLQDIWQRPDWPADRFYDDQYGEEAPLKLVENGWLTLEITEELPHVETPAAELEVLLTIGGVPAGLIQVPAPEPIISAQALRVALTTAGGLELYRICVREALVGKPLTAVTSVRASLQENLHEKRRQPAISLLEIAASIPENTLVLGRRFGVMNSSVSRRAQLPLAAINEVLELVRITRDCPVHYPPGDQRPEQIIYAPDWIVPEFQRRTQPPAPVGLPVDEADLSFTDHLPILLYHRVAPAAFDEQLQYLRANGYYSVSWETWGRAIASQTALPGKAVMLTFEGGDRAFFETTWPLLQRYGFQATVFLACGYIGERFGVAGDAEAVPLMGWPEIWQLRDQGVEFGSLGITYQPLTTLSPTEIVREVAGSRSMLEQGLERPVQVFAYPYGEFDPVVQHLVGACGYLFGAGGWLRLSGFSDPFLGLPRVEIMPSDGLMEFTSKLRFGWVEQASEVQ